MALTEEQLIQWKLELTSMEEKLEELSSLFSPTDMQNDTIEEAIGAVNALNLELEFTEEPEEEDAPEVVNMAEDAKHPPEASV